ncbi:MAG: cytochrome c3 family protein [Planctomycetota bacterium]|nr:cytochrome c3 family protein [Planctomycetota bacterium]
MALLRSIQRGFSAKFAAVGLALSTLAGCMIYEALVPTPPRFAFSHAKHVTDEGMACEDCHLPSESGGAPTIPVLAQCNLCHTEIDAEKPEEKRIAQFFEGTRMKAAHRGAVGGDVKFPHERHTEAGLDCSACHAGFEANADVTSVPRASMASCTDCHVERKVANECSTCHTTLREDVKPATHSAVWMRQHGSTVRGGSEATADSCSICHQESSCTTCHLATQPQNHTDYWRLRGHGISASLDRASCATCHRDDSCVRCHQESRPQSHSGNWGGTTSRHCTGCHFPIEGEGCSVCHNGTPSHQLATPKPADHTAGMNCRMCHGAGQPLPHVDNGDSCNLCHL